MSVVPFPSPAATAFPARESVDRFPARAVARESRLTLWRRRWWGRRELAALDLDQIREADLDPFAVRLEATKPFWRA